jgi:hypothetical protein
MIAEPMPIKASTQMKNYKVSDNPLHNVVKLAAKQKEAALTASRKQATTTVSNQGLSLNNT